MPAMAILTDHLGQLTCAGRPQIFDFLSVALEGGQHPIEGILVATGHDNQGAVACCLCR